MSKIKLNAPTGGGSVSLEAPSSTTSNADIELKLPVADGSAGQFMKTDGSGNLSFAAGGIPTGVIVMWSGSVASIPSGFVLCDGNNSTPDLRDRFIVGAKQDDSGTAKTNITGSLTSTGGDTTDSVSFNATTSYETTVTNASSAYNGAQGGSRDRHSHAVSGSMTVDILPPYFALAFIMKT